MTLGAIKKVLKKHRFRLRNFVYRGHRKDKRLTGYFVIGGKIQGIVFETPQAVSRKELEEFTDALEREAAEDRA